MPSQTASSQPDEAMVDASPSLNLDNETILQDMDSQVIRVLPGSSDTAASFQIDNEDHTLGNALRYIIMKNPEVEFCGYSIPHPSEAKLHIRIQTYGSYTAYQALEKGLDDLMDLCDVVTDKFTVARDVYSATNNGAM